MRLPESPPRLRQLSLRLPAGRRHSFSLGLRPLGALARALGQALMARARRLVKARDLAWLELHGAHAEPSRLLARASAQLLASGRRAVRRLGNSSRQDLQVLKECWIRSWLCTYAAHTCCVMLGRQAGQGVSTDLDRQSRASDTEEDVNARAAAMLMNFG